MSCPNCGTDDDDALHPIWEREAERHQCQPDYVGCTNCHQMHRPDLLRDGDEQIPPQAELTDHEISRLSIGNQHTNRLSIVEWQCVKGAALFYGVRDWTAKVDSTLTAEENISLMERHGSRHKTTTMRELRTPGEYHGVDS